MLTCFNRGTINLKNNVIIWSLSDFSSSYYTCEVRSPRCVYKGCHYTLAIWPCSQRDSEDWFGVCVYPKGELKLRDFFVISIVNDKGDIHSCKVDRSELGLYRNEKFMKWVEFLSCKSELVPNGCLTVVCEILSYEDASVQTCDDNSSTDDDSNADDNSITDCAMSLVHNAAEYLFEVISKSPNNCISYDDLKNLVKQADNDIASYFKKESKYEYIFNKYPEIFNCKHEMISLSDAFMSLYCHEKDSNFFTSCGRSLQMKRCAILYFLKILTLTGPQPYLSLFNMLVIDRTHRCAEYFNYTTDSDALNFFTSNSKYFVLSRNIVSVNSANLSCIDVLYEAEKNAIRRLNKYVCFLLKCFESLHYFRLKECISYSEKDCKIFLGQFSLLKQREFFENIPNTDIDTYGFLSLKNKEANIPFLKERKMKLLMVCILAFKKEMYFEDLINEAIERSDLSVVHYRTLSPAAQFRFLRNFPLIFIVSKDGYVKLLPNFSLTKCSLKDVSCSVDNSKQEVQSKAISSFDNLKQEVQSKTISGFDNTKHEVQSKAISSFDNLKQDAQSKTISGLDNAKHEVQSKAICSLDNTKQEVQSLIHPQPSKIKVNSVNQATISSKNRNILIQKHSREPQNVNSPIMNKYSLCLTALPITVNERVKVSVFYLLKYFYSLDYECILKTLLHALDDFRITFTSLSEHEKQKLILIFCNFMKTIPPFISDCETQKFGIINKEKFLLIVSYMLIHKKKMHYEKILSELMSKNIDNSLSACTKSNQMNYFRTFAGYMNITDDGYITLSETIDSVATVIDSYLHLFLKYQFISKCNLFLKTNEEVKFSPEKTLSKPECNPFLKTVGKGKISPEKTSSRPECNPFLKTNENVRFPAEKTLSKPECNPFLKTNKEVEFFPEKTLSKPACTFSMIKKNEKPKVPEFKEEGKMHNNMAANTFYFNNLPENICKYLSSSVYFLKTYFKIRTMNGYVLAASVISQNVLNNYYFNLNSTRQFEFIKECWGFVNKDDNISYHSSISENEEIILCISYLLLDNGKLHFNRIIKDLEKFSVAVPLCKKSPKEQFKYFKDEKAYFVIDSDGFVILTSSFKYMISLIDHAIAHTEKAKRSSLNQSSLSASVWKFPLKSDVFVTSSPNGISKNFPNGEHFDNSKIVIDRSHSRHESMNSNDVFKFSASSSAISSNSSSKMKNKCKKENQTLLGNIDQNVSATNESFILKSGDFSNSFLTGNSSKTILSSNSSKSISNIFNFSSPACVSDSSKFVFKSESNNNPCTTQKAAPNFLTNKKEFNQVKEGSKITGKNAKGKLSNTACNSATKDGIQVVFDSKDDEIQVLFDSHLQVNKLPKENKVSAQNQLIMNSQKLSDIGKRSKGNIFATNNSVNVSMKKTVVNEIKQDDKPSYVASTIKIEGKNKFVTNSPCQQLTSKGLSLSHSKEKDSICDTAILTDTFQKMSLSANSKSGNEETISKNTSKQLSTEKSNDDSIMNSDFNNQQSLKENQRSKLSSDVSSVEKEIDVPLDVKREFDCDSVHKTYISELIDSCLIKVPLDSSKASKSSLMKSLTTDSVEARNKVTSTLSDQVLDCSKNKSSILTDASNSIFCNKSDILSTSNCDSTPIPPVSKSRTDDAIGACAKVPSSPSEQLLNCTKNNSAISTEGHDSFCEKSNIPSTSKCDSASSLSVSKQAVNFFSVVLGNYERYNTGISASILKRHLNFASPEVQSFMQDHYEYNFISFFQNHTEVFYVSKQSQLIYLLKN